MDAPRTAADFIETIRAGLVCDRCGRYVGSLDAKRYLPPPYPVAVESTDDEVSALIAFEWHMLARLRQGAFTIRHPQRDGRCVSMREWLAREDGADDREQDDDAED